MQIALSNLLMREMELYESKEYLFIKIYILENKRKIYYVIG